MIIPALTPDTKFNLFKWNLLDTDRVEILDDMLQSFCESVPNIFESKNALTLFSGNRDTICNEAISDLSSILKLINVFANLLWKNNLIVMMYNFIIYVDELFALAKENICSVLNIEKWEIKQLQEIWKLDYCNQLTYFKNCKFEGESMKSWYKQFLKIWGVHNYQAISSLSSFAIFINKSEEKCMFTDFWKTLKRESLIYNWVKYKIDKLINEFIKCGNKINADDNNIYILTKFGDLWIEYQNIDSLSDDELILLFKYFKTIILQALKNYLDYHMQDISPKLINSKNRVNSRFYKNGDSWN